MTTQHITHARHRADVRPTTFLSGLPCAAVARRGSLGLAATGLALGLVAPTASAYDASTSPEPAATTSTVSASSGDSDTYTVRAGDTVAAIAQRHGTSVSAIISANGLGADALIFPGDVLTLSGGSGSSGAASDEGTSRTAESSASRGGERTQAPAQASTTSAPATASGSAILAEARKHVGTPYVWGGSAPGGFDCSGFTQYVFAQAGIDLPRTTGAQAAAGYEVSAAEARPGDLVYSPGHIGIYTGNGNHIAARNPGKPLQESPIYMSSPTFIRVSG